MEGEGEGGRERERERENNLSRILHYVWGSMIFLKKQVLDLFKCTNPLFFFLSMLKEKLKK
jgi:hypothetical protein